MLSHLITIQSFHVYTAFHSQWNTYFTPTLRNKLGQFQVLVILPMLYFLSEFSSPPF